MSQTTDFHFALHRLLPDVKYKVAIYPATGDTEFSNLYGHLIRTPTGYAFTEQDPEAPDQPKTVKPTRRSPRKRPAKKDR